MRIFPFSAVAERCFIGLVFVGALSSCADLPNRPYVATPVASIGCPAGTVAGPAELTTPEVPQDSAYTLHFLEFDDQGWSHPDEKSADKGKELRATPSSQIDCAIDDLSRKLEKGDVRAFVYVHGWHHSSKNDDRDLRRFRDILRKYSSDKNRQVVGFYVGWRGQTIDIPYLEDVTFWGRKNAAHHVAEGRVREFFARIKALRNGWNRRNSPRSKNCGKPEALVEGKGCPLRTVMIGHSFGSWILFAATSPYIMEVLGSSADLPKDMKTPATARERGIADLVLLLNPAFEASRYEPVHRAAQRYIPGKYETPLLVSITSTADGATRYAFPVARFFNSIFQYPAASDLESDAMRNTHGHIASYFTHELSLDPGRAHQENRPETACLDISGQPSDSDQLRTRFFSNAVHDGRLDLPAGWRREMCGGLTLTHLPDSGLGPYSIVWNIRTFGNIIPGHNEITEIPLRDFVEQLYADIPRAPRMNLRGYTIGKDDDE